MWCCRILALCSVHVQSVWHWVRALRHTNDGNLAKCRVRWKATIETWKSAHSRKWWSLSENCESGKWTITRERRPRLRCLKSFEYKMKWRISCSRSWLVMQVFSCRCVCGCLPRKAGLWQSSFMCGKWNPSIHSVLGLCIKWSTKLSFIHTNTCFFSNFSFSVVVAHTFGTENNCKSLSPNVEWDTQCALCVCHIITADSRAFPNSKHTKLKSEKLKIYFCGISCGIKFPDFPEIIFNPNLSLKYHGKHKRRATQLGEGAAAVTAAKNRKINYSHSVQRW